MKTPVYFISDVHLKLSLDKKEVDRRGKLYRLFEKVLETGGTCFFLGDLFDFYFEYPDLIQNCLIFMKRPLLLKERGQSSFLTGNHDYWTKEFMEDMIMDKVYFDDTQIEIDGKDFI